MAELDRGARAAVIASVLSRGMYRAFEQLRADITPFHSTADEQEQAIIKVEKSVQALFVEALSGVVDGGDSDDAKTKH